MSEQKTLSTVRNREINGYETTISLKVATTSILVGVGVVLSYLNPFGYFYIFGAKINPFAHFINVIAGVLLGPIYAVICAGLIATIRFSTGIGSILAFPGGMFGALIVGIARQILLKINIKKVKIAAFTEPIGTIFIAAPLSAYIVSMPIAPMMWLFTLPAVFGCILGWFVLIALEKRGLFENYHITISHIQSKNEEKIAIDR